MRIDIWSDLICPWCYLGKRLLHLAADRGMGDALKERLLRAVLGEGAVIADHATLAKLAEEVGLDGAEVRAVLASDTYRDAVEADEADARRHHLESVPFFLFGGTDRVTSARTVEDYERTLKRVLDR